MQKKNFEKKNFFPYDRPRPPPWADQQWKISFVEKFKMTGAQPFSTRSRRSLLNLKALGLLIHMCTHTFGSVKYGLSSGQMKFFNKGNFPLLGDQGKKNFFFSRGGSVGSLRRLKNAKKNFRKKKFFKKI